jgi:hypothetical protein
MDETLTYQKVVSFNLTFEKFKEMFEFPNEKLYEDVWEKLVARIQRSKAGKVVYTDNIESIEEEWEGYTLKEVVEASVTDAIDEVQAKAPVKRKLRKAVAEEAKEEVRKEEKPKKTKQLTNELDGKYIEVVVGMNISRKVYKCTLKEDGTYNLELQGDIRRERLDIPERKSTIKDIRITKTKTPEHLLSTYGEFIYKAYKGKDEWHSIDKILTDDEATEVEKAVQRGPTSQSGLVKKGKK